jgi:predicted nucleotidyltransferase
VSETAAAYRQRVAATIVAMLRDDPAIAAIGEGGAAARGRADEYSDLDLMIVAPVAGAEAIFALVETALRTIAPITHEWRVEPPGFPDMAQRFYFLADAPRHFAVDCSVITPAGIVAFLERERHGEAVVWFDRDATLVSRPVDGESLARRRAHRLDQLRGAVPVYSMLVDKELARGHALEACGFYQVLVRALIELLGMQHRPDRFDFGWRYIERELPPSAQQLIARHAYVPDGNALAALGASLVGEIKELLDRLSAAEAAAAVNVAARGDRPS